MRKDFKMRGIVGNPGQRNRLSFVSLTDQTNNRKSSGCSDNSSRPVIKLANKTLKPAYKNSIMANSNITW